MFDLPEEDTGLPYLTSLYLNLLLYADKSSLSTRCRPLMIRHFGITYLATLLHLA